MAIPSKRLVEDLRALSELAIEATTNTTDLVEQMHHNIALPHAIAGQAWAAKTRGLTGLIYDGVRGVTQIVGNSLDIALGVMTPFLRSDAPVSSTRDNFLSVINGIYGDRLTKAGNSLALDMAFFCDDQELCLSSSASWRAAVLDDDGNCPSKLMVFIHGLCLNRHGWEKDDAKPSSELARSLGCVPIYLNYNTGESIAKNGALFAQQLQALSDTWPEQITELTIVGHSMGGLVARSACLYGEKAGLPWLRTTKALVSIGTPHHGAPLEQAGQLLDQTLALTSYTQPLIRVTKLRSTGITNLRDGCISENEGEFVQLPEGIAFFAIAGVLNKQSNTMAESTLGDGLVPLDSALGQNRDASRVLAIDDTRKWVAYNMGHNEMLCHPNVFAQLQRWL